MARSGTPNANWKMWAYEYTFTQGGTYVIWIMAEDKAGNTSTVGPFHPGEKVMWEIYLPLVMRDGGGP